MSLSALSKGLLTMALALGTAGAVAAGSQFVETFDSGNAGGWTFGPPVQFETQGGNPGTYLRVPLLDTFAPQPRTTTNDSPFTGNYRERQVLSVGVDLITHAADFSVGGRPLSIMLISDNGTPAIADDDWFAYRVGPTNIPLIGAGWASYDFDIPSAETTLPAGWATLPLGGSAPANPDWNVVITDVRRLQFFYGDPEFFFIFQQWDLGLDNPRITTKAQGAGPGVVPPTVRLQRLGPTEIRFSWEASSCTGVQSYAVFEGVLGDFSSHSRIACQDPGGDGTEDLPVSAGNRYYIVVPFNSGGEGSYGQTYDFPTDLTLERPSAGAASCVQGQDLSCP